MKMRFLLPISAPGLIVVLGVSAGGAIWWKLRKRTKARNRERDTADLEKVKKQKIVVEERKKKSEAAIEEVNAEARRLREIELSLEAKLKKPG